MKAYTTILILLAILFSGRLLAFNNQKPICSSFLKHSLYEEIHCSIDNMIVRKNIFFPGKSWSVRFEKKKDRSLRSVDWEIFVVPLSGQENSAKPIINVNSLNGLQNEVFNQIFSFIDEFQCKDRVKKRLFSSLPLLTYYFDDNVDVLLNSLDENKSEVSILFIQMHKNDYSSKPELAIGLEVQKHIWVWYFEIIDNQIKLNSFGPGIQ
jgi:hypothetical protein